MTSSTSKRYCLSKTLLLLTTDQLYKHPLLYSYLSLYVLGKLSKLKSGEILDRVQVGGGWSSKNQKSPKFQLEKVQNYGERGAPWKSK